MHDVLGACPLDCPDGCSWVVTVENGEAVNLKGNREHPFTAGALCAKVNGYLEHAKAPDRLLYPLKRSAARARAASSGSRGTRRSRRSPRACTRSETSSAARPSGRSWAPAASATCKGLEGRAGQRLWNVLGASRHDMTICSVAGRVGATYTTGTAAGMDPETFAHSKLILLWGTNTLTSGHHLWKFILQARKNGAHIVAIDPLLTRTAAKADEHLAPLPGTDAALALGLLHVVVSMGAEDVDYLREHTVGWDAFKARILEFPPARAAELTGSAGGADRRSGRAARDDAPDGHPLHEGMQRHAGGGNALRLLYALPGVTGDWQYPGGGASYSTSGNFKADVAAIVRDDLLERPVRTLSMTRLGEGLLDLDDPPVKALVVYGANPMGSNPDQKRVARGLQREDLFTVVIEQFETDTVDYADIVLPATMQTEHLDVNDGYGHMYVSLNRPAVAPAGECLPATETFRRLARAMGLTEPLLYDDDETLARTLLGSERFEKLWNEGWMRVDDASPYVPFTNGFPTPSGKLEFVSELAAADGHDPLPGYTPPQRAEADSEHPLSLIAPASHWFLNTMFANKPDLMKRAGGPRIELHPDDAATRDLQTGDTARVFNARGVLPGRGRSLDACPPGRDRLDQGPLAQTRPRRGQRQRHRRGARRRHGRRRGLPRQPRAGREG